MSISMNALEPQDEEARVIIHLDLDCFYAQVHMLMDPELQTRPLGENVPIISPLFPTPLFV